MIKVHFASEIEHRDITRLSNCDVHLSLLGESSLQFNDRLLPKQRLIPQRGLKVSPTRSERGHLVRDLMAEETPANRRGSLLWLERLPEVISASLKPAQLA